MRSWNAGEDANLVVNAPDMAITNCWAEPGGIVHAHHGTYAHLVGFHEQNLPVRDDAFIQEYRRRSR